MESTSDALAPNTSQSPTRKTVTPEVIEEYKAIMENAATISARRQTMTDVFVGINIAFLGGIGLVAATWQLHSWWGVVAAAVIMFGVYPINRTWRTVLKLYREVLVSHYTSLQKMEAHYSFVGNLNTELADSDPVIISYRHSRSTTVSEIKLATYFLVLYPVLAAAIALGTLCVKFGIITFLVTWFNHLIGSWM